MGCTNVLHEPPEAFHFLDIDLPRPFLRIHDDSAAIVSIVPRFDQDVDLPANAGDSANDVRVWRHAQISFRLLGEHMGDQSLIDLPIRCPARRPLCHNADLPLRAFLLRNPLVQEAYLQEAQ